MWDPYADFESVALPNGLTVHAAHWPGRPWVAMGFLVHSGAEHDPIGLEGLAHFVEHLVSENAGVSKREVRALFEDCGGTVDLGATGYPYTQYRFFAPADKTILAKAFSMFGHMLLSAKFKRCIERERQVILGEFSRCYPFKFKFDLDMRERKMLHAGCWLERFTRPLGSPESIERISQNDLRSYYDTHYTPANMSIVSVGGMTLEEVASLLSESPFAMSKKGSRIPLPTPTVGARSLSENRHVFEVSKHITAPFEVGAYRSAAKIPGNASEHAIHIMRRMFDKILKEEVREQRAWAYAINSSQYNFRHFHEFLIGCDALALKAIDSIEEVVETCIASIRDREDLFEQTKQSMLANCFMIDPNAQGTRNDALKELATYQRIVLLAEDSANLEHVSMDDVRGLLQWLRPEQRWTLIMRP